MDRSDVFISYRRKNIDFVRQLDTALRGAGLNVWVDWEDILPASPSYLEDIHNGIDGTDALVAVLSPDYFESPHCMAELQYAVDRHKRIIPVVYDKSFDEARVPDAISRINRIFFCPHIDEQNTFDTAFPKLMVGIRTDHEYVRQHTRYLLEAQRWLANDRDPSYLLVGSAIDEAETWQIKAAFTEPDPSKEQVEFIVASRRADNERREREQARREHENELKHRARNRQRNFLLVLIGGLTLAIVLLIVWANTAESSSLRLAEQNLLTLLRLGKAEVDRPEFHQIIDQLLHDEDGVDAELFDRHVADLERLSAVDPNALFSTVLSNPATGEVMRLAGENTWGDTLTLPLDHAFWVSSNEPQIIRETIQDDEESEWVTGWIDIPDPAGDVYASVLLEVRSDEYFLLEDTLNTALGFIAMLYMGIIIYYLWRLLRYGFRWLRARGARTVSVAPQNNVVS